MALINSKNTTRIVPPHEPESWFELRPIRAGDGDLLTSEGGQVRLSLDLLARIITSWSYKDENGEPIPVSQETVEQLDLDTYVWLVQQSQELSGIRDTAEKKDSNNGSLSTSDLEKEPSLTSSST